MQGLFWEGFVHVLLEVGGLHVPYGRGDVADEDEGGACACRRAPKSQPGSRGCTPGHPRVVP